MFGAALPQLTVGPSVPWNTGSDALRQLSPSDDRETSWAQRKTGSKWADGRFTTRSSSGGLSGAGRDRRFLQKQCRDSSATSSPPRRRSPPSKRPRAVSTSPLHPSFSPDDRWWSPDIIAEPPLTHPPAVIAVLLLPPPNGTIPEFVPLYLVGASRPAWLGDLLGTTLCPREAVLPRTCTGDHPGASPIP